MNYEKELLEVIERNKRFMTILTAADEIGLPQWYIGAGLIRNTVWDYLHGYDTDSPINDIDLVFFSKSDVGEDGILARLTELVPEKWELKNAATMHIWYKRDLGMEIKPLRNVYDDISCWPEIASCVAIKMVNGKIHISAPWGLDDLFNMIWRRNTKGERVITKSDFLVRLEKKNISEKYPRVKIFYN